jgi:hypothetical protein
MCVGAGAQVRLFFVWLLGRQASAHANSKENERHAHIAPGTDTWLAMPKHVVQLTHDVVKNVGRLERLLHTHGALHAFQATQTQTPTWVYRRNIHVCPLENMKEPTHDCEHLNFIHHNRERGVMPGCLHAIRHAGFISSCASQMRWQQDGKASAHTDAAMGTLRRGRFILMYQLVMSSMNLSNLGITCSRPESHPENQCGQAHMHTQVHGIRANRSHKIVQSMRYSRVHVFANKYLESHGMKLAKTARRLSRRTV